MKRIKTILFSIVFCAIVFPILAESVSAQALRIGFVRDERIQKEFPAWVKADEQWRTEMNAWEEEAIAKQQELEQLKADYEKQRLILSDEKKREKEAAISAKEESLDAYTKQVYGPNGTAERKNAQLLEPLLRQINDAIQAVALEGNYDVIFTMKSGLSYIKDEYDITDAVLKYLEENTN